MNLKQGGDIQDVMLGLILGFSLYLILIGMGLV